MTTLIIAAGTVSQPIFAPPGALVTVTPASGATAKVEYTKGSGADVINGAAQWQTWAKGASATSTTSDLLNEPAYLRVTATSGSVALAIDETPQTSLLDAYRSDWASAALASSGSSSGVTILAQSGVASSVTGTTSETILATVTVPGGTVGANQTLRISTLWSATGATGNKTARLKLGTTAYLDTGLTTTVLSLQVTNYIRLRGSAASQVGFANAPSTQVGSNAGAIVTSSYDMGQDQAITITGTLVSAADTLTLDGYTVEVLK